MRPPHAGLAGSAGEGTTEHDVLRDRLTPAVSSASSSAASVALSADSAAVEARPGL
jgi:hypothetical protein